RTNGEEPCPLRNKATAIGIANENDCFAESLVDTHRLLHPLPRKPRDGEGATVYNLCDFSHRKVLRLLVRHDDCRGRLLGVELVLLAEADADLLGVEQLQ